MCQICWMPVTSCSACALSPVTLAGDPFCRLTCHVLGWSSWYLNSVAMFESNLSGSLNLWWLLMTLGCVKTLPLFSVTSQNFGASISVALAWIGSHRSCWATGCQAQDWKLWAWTSMIGWYECLTSSLLHCLIQWSMCDTHSNFIDWLLLADLG